MANLRTYLSEKAISRKAFAQMVNISPNYLSELIAGKKTPSLQIAYDISLATKNRVPMTVWLNSVPDAGPQISKPHAGEMVPAASEKRQGA